MKITFDYKTYKILHKKHSKTGLRDGPGDLGGHLGHHQAFYSKTVSGDYSFLGGLWVAFGPLELPKASAMPFGRTFLGAILNEKSEKRHPKRHPKNDAEKTQKKYAKRLPK